MLYYGLLFIVVLTLAYVDITYAKIKAMPEYDPNDDAQKRMPELAAIVRKGSETFLKIEFKTIVIVVVILAVIFSLFIESTSGISFLIGATMSSFACIFSMKAATYANIRTTKTALDTYADGPGATIKVALKGGSIAGLSVQAFGTLGLVIVLIIFGMVDPSAVGYGLVKWLPCNPTIMRITTYSLGCSIVAMFNRVAGGNFTKSADIGSDIVGKNRRDMPEDDCRNPATMADFVGDNVNDIAGNCSDLLESYVATIVSSLLIASTVYNGALTDGVAVSEALFKATCMFPLLLAGGGLLGSLLGIAIVTIRKMGDSPAKELDLVTYISSGFMVIVGIMAAYFCFGRISVYSDFKCGWISPFLVAIFGTGVGVLIGKITEYYTSADFKPTKRLAKAACEGEAFIVTRGDSLGWKSCLIPVLAIAFLVLFSYMLCGQYGIAIAALGMLSTVGTTVSIDAFGPIADNAGGFAEACHLNPLCRKITDMLDSVGNTTAAMGKGSAIGGAAVAVMPLIVAYVGSYTIGAPVLNAVSPFVISGLLIGAGGVIVYFVGMLGDNTIDSAILMANESDNQLSIPGVMEGKVNPDYNKCIDIATKQALKKMLTPAMLAVVIPILSGFSFGVEFLGGMLLGSALVAIPLAIFMSTSGGAFDNAKKYIEAGELEGYGKGSDAHKASVTGDTIGDTRKDVIGVALDIFIKMMATVANTLSPIIRSISLFH